MEEDPTVRLLDGELIDDNDSALDVSKAAARLHMYRTTFRRRCIKLGVSL